MYPRCQSCGAENPATNRYCGQCGKALVPQTGNPSSIPEKAWRVGSPSPEPHLEPSSNLPPEMSSFEYPDIFSVEQGTDGQIRPSGELVDPLSGHFERDREQRDEFQRGGEAHEKARATEAERRSDFLRWDIGQSTNRTGISGPSFLGLSGDYNPEDEDLPPELRSHLRRNIALAVAALAMLLITLQWRSIRNYGLPYVQAGSMRVPRSTLQAKNPPSIAADNTSRDLGLLPAGGSRANNQTGSAFATGEPSVAPSSQKTAKTVTGSPQAVESSPNADRALPVRQAEQDQTENAPLVAASTPTQAVRPSSVAAQAGEPSSMGAPAGVPAPATSTVGPQVAPNSSSIKERQPLPAPSKSAPGADEMRRAANAVDAETRATWLWRAVGKGNPQAPVELARMYVRGDGVTQSCNQAQLLLRAAASHGNKQAIFALQQIRTRGGCPSL